MKLTDICVPLKTRDPQQQYLSSIFSFLPFYYVLELASGDRIRCEIRTAC